MAELGKQVQNVRRESWFAGPSCRRSELLIRRQLSDKARGVAFHSRGSTHVAFCVWLPLSAPGSLGSSMWEHVSEPHYALWSNNISMYGYNACVCLWLDRHLGCFFLPAILGERSWMSFHTHVPTYLGNIPAESRGNKTLDFLRN